MHRRYEDILSRIASPPLWWDMHGTPRFEPFRPELCGVYDDIVAYAEIACQACGRRFMVAVEASMVDMLRAERGTLYPSRKETGDFHYGDPPYHEDCRMGLAMNVETVRIHEFWRRRDRRTSGMLEWERDHAYEIDYVGDGDLHDGGRQ